MALQTGATEFVISSTARTKIVDDGTYQNGIFTLSVKKGGNLDGCGLVVENSNEATPDVAVSSHWTTVEGARRLQAGVTYSFQLFGTVAVRAAAGPPRATAYAPSFTVQVNGTPV